MPSAQPKRDNDLDRLSEAVYSLGTQICRIEASQEYLKKNFDQIHDKITLIDERHIRQDTILRLFGKVWKITPSLIGIIFVVSLCFMNASIDVSKYVEIILKSLLGS